MKAGINGRQIAYSDEGQGPAIVLIHGFPLSRAMWAPQIAALTSAGYRVIAPDLAGFGESECGDGPYSMDRLADDVAQLMLQLGIGRAVVGGMSMGGYVLLNLLARHPKRIAGAAFLVTRCTADDDTGREKRNSMAEAVRQGRRHEVIDAFTQLVFAPNTLEQNPALVDQVRGIMEQSSDEGLIGALHAMRERPDYSSRLGDFPVPALVVGASEDRAVPPETIPAFTQGLPAGRSCIIDSAGHMANLEQPEAFNQCLLDFLKLF